MASAQKAAAGRPQRTFLDWGMAVPFTTPVLCHARVRPAERGRVDLIMPNPSGGKGVYVVDLGAVGELFTLTVHDRLLVERLVALPVASPSGIREAVRELAAEGAAGRATRRAAEAADAEDLAARALIEFTLVGKVLTLVRVEAVDWRRLCDGDKAFRAYLRGRLAEVAPRIGATADELFGMFEKVGVAAVNVGAPGSGTPSRNERHIGQLARFAREVGAWGGCGGELPDELARDVAACAERTLADARAAQEAARALLDDVLALVRAWRAGADATAERFARPDWLLDGWQQVCATWRAAAREERAAQRAALEQIRSLIPFLDRTASPELARISDDRHEFGRRVRLHEDWRTGMVAAADTARNEALRAETAL